MAVVGAGNVATSLAVALRGAGYRLSAVWSRTREAALMLAKRVDCIGVTDIKELPDVDVVFIAVSDDALPDVATAVARRLPQAIVLHTAGSVPMRVLREAGCNNCGVFYPMQTFSKERIIDFSTVSIFVEGCNEALLTFIERIASRLTNKIYRATSEQRSYLHLAAVFACNFANATYTMAAEIMQQNGLPFVALLPLIDETAAKVHQLSPQEAQTGPASRGDKGVMERQRNLLDGDLQRAYDFFSDYIQKMKRQ